MLGAQAAFHGDELSDQGCGALAAEVGARSVSHLEMLNADGVQAMARAGVHAVLLPTTACVSSVFVRGCACESMWLRLRLRAVRV